jgi:pimeloyl-ACP methyl ester carboxylesterase
MRAIERAREGAPKARDRRTRRHGRLTLALLLAVALTMAAVPGTGPGDGAEASTTGRTPILFVPGITGSSLHDAGTGEEIWPSVSRLIGEPWDDSHLLALELARNPDWHPPIGVGISVGEVISSISKSNVYGDLIAQIEAAGYVRGYDFETVPLDWRRSADLNAQELLAKIDQVRARTGAPKVNILAHSQGGLVTSAALSNPALANQGKVDRVVTLGSPFLGAGKAFGVLEYGEPCFADFLGICMVNRGMVHHLSQGWPGFHELLPSQAYDHAVGPALITHDGTALNHSQVLNRLIGNGRNARQLTDAANFHNAYDYWSPADPDVQLRRLASTGLGTIQGVQEVLTQQCDWWFFNCRDVIDFEFMYTSGDETVAYPSAALLNWDTGFDYRGSGETWYVNDVGHTAMAGDSGIIGWAIDYFEAASPSGVASQDFASSDMGIFSFHPQTLSGLELRARGPVTTSMTDSEGRREVADAGADADTSIPGASIAKGAVSETAFVSHPDRYTTTWTATDRGEVAVRAAEYAGDEIVSTVAYPSVVLEAGGTITLTHEDSVDGLPSLAVDHNGDGTVDAEVAAASRVDGAAASDRTAPVSAAEVRRAPGSANTSGGEALVRLEASDPGPAGVDRIEYAVSATGETGTYDGEPLVLPAEGQLFVRAVDRAGNVQASALVVDLEDLPGRPEWVGERNAGR